MSGKGAAHRPVTRCAATCSTAGAAPAAEHQRPGWHPPPALQRHPSHHLRLPLQPAGRPQGLQRCPHCSPASRSKVSSDVAANLGIDPALVTSTCCLGSSVDPARRRRRHGRALTQAESICKGGTAAEWTINVQYPGQEGFSTSGAAAANEEAVGRLFGSSVCGYGNMTTSTAVTVTQPRSSNADLTEQCSLIATLFLARVQPLECSVQRTLSIRGGRGGLGEGDNDHGDDLGGGSGSGDGKAEGSGGNSGEVSSSAAIAIGLVVGIGGALLIAIVAVVVFRRRSNKRREVSLCPVLSCRGEGAMRVPNEMRKFWVLYTWRSREGRRLRSVPTDSPTEGVE